MEKQHTVYLIDFDNTLFDTDKLKKDISFYFSKKFGAKNLAGFWKTYSEEIHKTGYLDIKRVGKILSEKFPNTTPEEFENVFLKRNFKKHVFSKSKELIKILKKKGKVILYTLGDSYYQPVKIEKSGIKEAVGKKNIYLTQEKIKTVGAKVLELKSLGYESIFIIDDRADVLEKAKKVYPEVITVWFKYGKNKNMPLRDPKLINLEIENQEELIFCLENYVSTIKQNAISDTVSVQKNITNNSIKQLIKYTLKDNQISKFTHDNERFKSIKSFLTWKNRNKYIYTIRGKRGKLYGIIWFSKKQFPYKTDSDFKYTFAIRTYKPIRGKGLSAKFMQAVFKDFKAGKDKNIWLSTHKENKTARNLYENYGFKMIGDKSGKEVLYIYRG